MGNVIKRKCFKCKGEIVIDKNNITDVVLFDLKYYHSSCFEECATQKASSKKGKPQKWQDALDRIWELELDAKKTLEHNFYRDDLNEWLLNNYDITSVPSYFWTSVEDLANGKYQRKKCKPIAMDQIYKIWVWGQPNLNRINAQNKTKGIGPKNDTDRLQYDLAILLNHTSDYIKSTTRTKEETSEIKRRVEKTNKFNSEKIYVKQEKKQEDNDILNLMNDIF